MPAPFHEITMWITCARFEYVQQIILEGTINVPVVVSVVDASQRHTGQQINNNLGRSRTCACNLAGHELGWSRVAKIRPDRCHTRFCWEPFGHGCPCQTPCWNSAATMRISFGPTDGERVLTPGHPRVMVRNVRTKSRRQSLCLSCFCFLDSEREELGP